MCPSIFCEFVQIFAFFKSAPRFRVFTLYSLFVLVCACIGDRWRLVLAHFAETRVKMSEGEESNRNIIPTELKLLRACLICTLVKTRDQFLNDGSSSLSLSLCAARTR
jgi:hypothetical protein